MTQNYWNTWSTKLFPLLRWMNNGCDSLPARLLQQLRVLVPLRAIDHHHYYLRSNVFISWMNDECDSLPARLLQQLRVLVPLRAIGHHHYYLRNNVFKFPTLSNLNLLRKWWQKWVPLSIKSLSTGKMLEPMGLFSLILSFPFLSTR